MFDVVMPYNHIFTNSCFCSTTLDMKIGMYSDYFASVKLTNIVSDWIRC